MISLKDGKKGSLTIAGAVSPAGGNFEEPVTQATLGVVGAFLGLSSQRSDARRYPAIDPLISWSKYIEAVGLDLKEEMPDWLAKNRIGAKFLFDGDEIGKRMEVVGEEGISLEDLIIYLKSELYEFCYLQQNAFDKEDAYCPLHRQFPLFNLIQKIFAAKFTFDNKDEARNYFLSLQNDIKNMNFMAFDKEEYKKAYQTIDGHIENAAEKEALKS